MVQPTSFRFTLLRFGGPVLLGLGLLASCQRPAATSAGTESSSASPAATATTAAPLPNPVLPGDFPDPSVTKIGDTYWATATSSNWGPTFPLLKSKNLTDWELVGHVFPNQLPAWADYYFWAPEISQEGSKTYIYYTAHQRGAPWPWAWPAPITRLALTATMGPW
ncbi:glycoside hydrolase family 43 protein [Hymenobacter sp. J193]|uniref:glycoside hydrolase family 43 protein n=1 Tax=Hymenobacter sp. J193 TaxID=2898429 RepID=UPI002151D2F4|nr:family 43 glycosylhydrolase [Hymenobacter sp. J193]